MKDLRNSQLNRVDPRSEKVLRNLERILGVETLRSLVDSRRKGAEVVRVGRSEL